MITRLNAANEVYDTVLAALIDDDDLTDLIPATSIYPPQPENKPARPFVLLGVPIVTPRYIDCGDASDGSNITAAVHCFADASDDIPDPRVFSLDVASHIARIINALDDVDIDYDDDISMNVYVVQIQAMQDGSPSSWHSFVTFRAEAS